jgi:acetolactate synthase-1/2/3 large subunit
VEGSGGDLLVAAMESLGVDTAFGLVSVHNQPLVDAVDRRLRFVPVRHEAAAVNAADAYGRATDGIGVAITSTGTGAGNAAGSLVEALTAGAAVLHVTGQIPSAHLGASKGFIHETKDQRGMLEAVSKAAFTIEPAEDAAATLAAAASLALTPPRGPVSVEWPIDLQHSAHEIRSVALAPGQPPELDEAALDRAAELLATAARPLIWAGGGAVHARAEVLELLERIRAGLLTSNAGRGTVEESHSACIGNFAANPRCRPLLEQADLLLSLGTHFRSNETADYALPLPRPHVQVDVDPAAIGRSYPADLRIVGDAKRVVAALLERLPARTAADAGWLTEVAKARRLSRHHLRQAIGWQNDVCQAIRKFIPHTSVIARDVTIPSSSWGNRLLSIYDPLTNVFARGGGIGQGLAMGIGAAIARPRHPSVLLVGDGGLAVHLGELMTLAQERPWLVVVLFDDGGYGVLRNAQDAFVGRRAGVDLLTPDFELLARSVGIPYWKVDELEQFEEAFARAVAERGPALVVLDVGRLGPMPEPFTPPVKIGA